MCLSGTGKRILYNKQVKTCHIGRSLFYYCYRSDAYCVDHLKIKKIRRGWIVVNTKTGIHAHFRSQYGCYLIKMFISKSVYPDNIYLQESYRRLTQEKKKYKQRYININKGVVGD